MIVNFTQIIYEQSAINWLNMNIIEVVLYLYIKPKSLLVTCQLNSLIFKLSTI